MVSFVFLFGIFIQGGHQITKTKFHDFSMTFPDLSKFPDFFSEQFFSKYFSFTYFNGKKKILFVIFYIFLLIPYQVAGWTKRQYIFSPTSTRNLRYIKLTYKKLVKFNALPHCLDGVWLFFLNLILKSLSKLHNECFNNTQKWDLFTKKIIFWEKGLWKLN